MLHGHRIEQYQEFDQCTNSPAVVSNTYKGIAVDKASLLRARQAPNRSCCLWLVIWVTSASSQSPLGSTNTSVVTSTAHSRMQFAASTHGCDHKDKATRTSHRHQSQHPAHYQASRCALAGRIKQANMSNTDHKVPTPTDMATTTATAAVIHTVRTGTHVHHADDEKPSQG